MFFLSFLSFFLSFLSFSLSLICFHLTLNAYSIEECEQVIRLFFSLSLSFLYLSLISLCLFRSIPLCLPLYLPLYLSVISLFPSYPFAWQSASRCVAFSFCLCIPLYVFLSPSLHTYGLAECEKFVWHFSLCIPPLSLYLPSISLYLPAYLSLPPPLFLPVSPDSLLWMGILAFLPLGLSISLSISSYLFLFPFYLFFNSVCLPCGLAESAFSPLSISVSSFISLCLPILSPCLWSNQQSVPSPLCLYLFPLYLSLSPLPSSLAESAFSPLCLSVSTLSFSVSPTQWPGRECLLPSVSLCLHSIFLYLPYPVAWQRVPSPLCLFLSPIYLSLSPYPVAWQRVRRLSGLYLWGGSTSSGTASKVIIEANNTNQINIYIDASKAVSQPTNR